MNTVQKYLAESLVMIGFCCIHFSSKDFFKIPQIKLFPSFKQLKSRMTILKHVLFIFKFSLDLPSLQQG